MPVDKAELEAYLDEVGFSPEVRATIMGEFSDESKASKFAGQRLRHQDYTRKTQTLSQKEKEIQEAAQKQITEYASALQNAQSRIDQITSDLESRVISEATANARLARVKSQYNLTDEEIPAVEPAKAIKQGGDVAVDIDAKLAQFKKDFLNDVTKVIMPELTALADIAPVQYDIARQHESLTGKPLSRADMLAINKHSKDHGLSLESAWEQIHGIQDVRVNQRVDIEVNKRLAKAEEDRKTKASEEALAGVRRPSEMLGQTKQSPVLGREFHTEPDQYDPPAQVDSTRKSATGTQSQPSSPKLSGAERAAAKFLERRNQGIPLGKDKVA